MPDTLHRSTLKNLGVISLEIKFDLDGIHENQFPLFKDRLEKLASKSLDSKGVSLDKSSSTKLFLNISIKNMGSNEIAISLIKIETFIRENVTIKRNQSDHTIDTWRYPGMAGIYVGDPKVDTLSPIIDNEVLRQIDAFGDDYQKTGNLSSDASIKIDSTRVTKAKALLAAAATYASGCSEFISAVLSLTTAEDANTIMGSNPVFVGDNNSYSGLVPGDIVGWKVNGGNGHVAIYIGEPGTKFIDVKDLGEKPRKVVNGYGPNRSLFKSSKY